MFAPHCPTCARRVLLSTDQIVLGSPGLVLRCHCGELLAWDQRPPAPELHADLALAGVAAAPAGR